MDERNTPSKCRDSRCLAVMGFKMRYQLYALINGNQHLQEMLMARGIESTLFMSEYLFLTSAGGRWRMHGGQPDFSPAIKLIYLAYLRSNYNRSPYISDFINEIDVSVGFFDKYWDYREHHGPDDSIEGMFDVIASSGNISLLDSCSDHPLIKRLKRNHESHEAD